MASPLNLKKILNEYRQRLTKISEPIWIRWFRLDHRLAGMRSSAPILIFFVL